MKQDNRDKGILYGLPVILTEDGCHATGPVVHFLLWHVFIGIFGFNGWVMPYAGSYWLALWHWLFGTVEDPDPCTCVGCRFQPDRG